MSSESEQHSFRRKRRRFARRADRVLQENTDGQERCDSANDHGNFPHVDFVRLISLIIEHESTNPVPWKHASKEHICYAWGGRLLSRLQGRMNHGSARPQAWSNPVS